MVVQPTKTHLTDRQLATLAKRYLVAKKRADEAEAVASGIKNLLLAELADRKDDLVTVFGLRIKKRWSTRREVDVQKLYELVGRSRFARITRPAIDTERWNAAVVAGMITEDVRVAVETETPTAAWVEVKAVV